MLWIFIAQAVATLVSLEDHATPLIFTKKLSGQTVVLVQTKVYRRPASEKGWEPAENTEANTALKIYKSSDKTEPSEPEQKNLVFKDSKHEVGNTYFFTASETNYYSMVFSVMTDYTGDLALEIEVFEGRAWTPEIVSGTDYQMEWLTQKMGDLVYSAKRNFDLQKLDEEDEIEYVTLYNDIFRLIYRVVIVKIVIVLVTMFYFNKKTKEFYVSKKILSK
jgi:hypothetical protein